ncbi:MAG: hypothetical protein COB35_05055 [Gammaproteobacteria bacterium]|nr:MAG: hypothetical protein COB35_05055 [Gammaproteobacteria bacterium]
MPPVVIAVVAGAAAIGAGVAIGTAIAIGLAAGALSSVMSIKIPSAPDVEDVTREQQLHTSAAAPRRGIYGETTVSGLIVGYGKANNKHHMVIEIAGHPCEALEIFEIEGKTPAEIGSKIKMTAYLGDQTAVHAPFKTTVHGWTNAHIGTKQTYVALEVDIDNELFPNGINKALFKVKGKRLYDPRLDSTVGGAGSHRANDETTWQWTENSELIAFDFARFGGFKAQPLRRFDLAHVAAQANICDELVTFKDKGVNKTEKRFTCNGSYNFNERTPQVLKKILSSMGGKAYRSGAVLKLQAAAFGGMSATTLTSNDAAGEIQYRPARPIRERTNFVRGVYVDPNLKYQPTDCTPQTSSLYVTQDNNVHLERDLQLHFTQSETMAQRLCKIDLERNRAGFVINFPAKSVGLECSPGKVITLNIPEDNIFNKAFLVEDWTYDNNSKITNLVLTEDAVALYSDSLVPTLKDLTPNLVMPDATAIAAPTGLSYENLPAGGSYQGLLKWNKNTDANVSGHTVNIYQGGASFMWVMFADDAVGTGITSNGIGKIYIGVAFNKQSSSASLIATDYTWVLADGNGILMPQSISGEARYLWLKFSIEPSTMAIVDAPNNQFIGYSIAQTVQAKSNNTNDYQWLLATNSISLAHDGLLVLSTETTSNQLTINNLNLGFHSFEVIAKNIFYQSAVSTLVAEVLTDRTIAEPTLSLAANKHIFFTDSAGTTTPSSIVITATHSDTTVLYDNIVWTLTPSIPFTNNKQTISIAASDFGADQVVKVSAVLAGLTGEFTLLGVKDGANGNNGLSAYEIWLSQGNTGTEADFIAYLNATDGVNGNTWHSVTSGAPAGTLGVLGDFALSAGRYVYEKTAAATWTYVKDLLGPQGNNGLSAYQIWLNQGNSGTEADFIAYLNATDGVNGNTWFSVTSGAPAGTLGVVGDFALSAGRYVYEKTAATTWTYVKDLLGPQGIPGDPGQPGQNGTRGSRWFYYAITTSAWTNAKADLAVTSDGSTKVIRDIVTLFNNSAGFSQTKFWDGTNWLAIAQVVDGNLLVDGTIGAAKLLVDEIFAQNVTATGVITGATLQTKLSNASGVRVVMQDTTEPFQVWNGTSLLFGVDATTATFGGNLADGIINNTNMFSQDILSLLMSSSTGSTGGGSGTGGSTSVAFVTLSGIAATNSTLQIPAINTTPITISVTITDQGSRASPAYVAPQWNVKVRRDSTAGVILHNVTYTGSATTEADLNREVFFLDKSITFQDPSPTSGKYVLTVSRVAGSYLIPKIKTYSIAQAVVGGAYSLPTAASNQLGGIKVGANLSISNGVLSANNQTTTSIAWSGITGRPSTFNPALTGNLLTAVPSGALFTDTNTNTTYTAGPGLNLIGTSFSANFGTTVNTIAQGNHTHSASSVGALAASATAVNSDKVDGYHASAYNVFNGNYLVTRNVSGYIYSNYFNMTANTTTAAATKVAVEIGADKFLRWQTPIQFLVNAGVSFTDTTYSAGTALTLSGTTFSVNLGAASNQAAYGNHNHDATYVKFLSGTYPQLEAGSTWIRTPTNGLLPAANGASYLGTSSWRFIGVYAGVGNFSGNVTCAGIVNAADEVATCDSRVKENQKVIKDASAKRQKLTGKTFNRTDLNGRLHAGIIAQDLENNFDEALHFTKDEKLGKKYNVSTPAMIGLLVEAANEDRKLIDRQQQQINELIELVGKLANGN